MGRILEGTVNALTSALEKRDPYTTGHQYRVTKLACAISEEMDLAEEKIDGIRIVGCFHFSKEQLIGIRMSGLLHDIGKISVPTDILNKPSKLSINEFNLLKEHLQIGYDILKNVDFEQPVAQIILQHHERINGSGYPHGISGEDILLQAKILAVADTVEAMASHRPYRPALGIDRALDEISQNRNILYDPKVVDICLKLFTDNDFVFE